MLDPKRPLALVTGGNSGIGKWTAIGLARRGYTVVITSRSMERGAAAVGEIRGHSESGHVSCMALDLASFASIEEFSAAFTQRCSELHVLVANAGLVLGDRRRTCEGFEMTFGVNHLGHFLLTEALLPLLRAGAPARIVVVASEAHRRRGGLDFDDLQSQRRYDGFAVYCRSKLANIYFTRELARRLSDEGITVNAVHPGVVASGLGRDGDVKGMFGWLIRRAAPFLLSEARGAETSVYVATAPELEGRTGGYFAKCRPIEPSKEALDDASARRLWQISEQLVSNREALPGVPNAPTLDDA